MSRQLWARHSASKERPRFRDLISCLEERQHELQSYSQSAARQSSNSQRSPTSRRVAIQEVPSSNANQCANCGESHPLYRCKGFLSLNAEQRKIVVMQANVCYNCLIPGHLASKCRSIKCRTCQAVADYKLRSGLELPCRLLLDSASEVSLITRNATKILQLQWIPFTVPISGVANQRSTTTIGATSLVLQSKHAVTKSINITALIVNKIIGQVPSKRLVLDEHSKIINHPRLADPQFYKPAPIDILIGADPTLRLFTGGVTIFDKNFIVRNTMFGWVVTGKTNSESTAAVTTVTSMQNDGSNNGSIEAILKRFWELESVPETPKLTQQEMLCETHYATTTRHVHGRYLVRLPFKENRQRLGESRTQAIRRLHHLEKRFNNDIDLRKNYNTFMAEYIALGHMTPITKRERQLDPSRHFYIPHHAVIKLSNRKTKLRVVFDASAKSATGASLNDNLLVGPTLQSDLVTILGRFRTFPIAMTADIEKMYRQVMVNGDDANYQRIVWRFSTEEAEVDYKLNTVTYGTASAAYQAIRTLNQIADDQNHISQHAAESIKANFYVDDYLGGAKDIKAATNLKHNICSMLRSGGMILRGWMSNMPQLFDAEEQILLLDNENASVLGLQWNPRTDDFGFNIQPLIPSCLTKRTFLSTSAKVFDPLGFLSPVTVVAKIHFQQMWSLGIGWDDPIPDEIARRWMEHISQFKELSAVKVQRLVSRDLTSVDLIGFSDASEKAYSAIIYARERHPDINGAFNITLVAARTKVAPMKPTTLPRLELCGADLLGKLMRKTADALSINLINCYAYSDSQVVLAWLSDNPRRWKTFVANRTSSILEIIPPERWNYVNSKDNPADCASRGLEPRQLVRHELWWHGPLFLSSNISLKSNTSTADTSLEMRSVNIVTATAEHINIQHFSNLGKLLRITALCLRFINNSRCGIPQRKSGHLQRDELKCAMDVWIRKSQTDTFEAEYTCLQANRSLPHNSHLRALDPFLDSEKLLRISGRIQRSGLPYEEMHPIILHRRYPLSKLIVTHEHLENLHASHRLLHTILLRKYWIVGARVIVKQIIRQCVTCTRHRGKSLQQKMAPLPAVRVTPSRPFFNSGVDYAGPIMVKSWRGRSAKTYKAYIALFVCLATKAIHIEAVTELTTDCFLAALRRFISRRGCPQKIYSDNGTNFVGASRELDKLFDFIKSGDAQHAISQFSTSQQMSWHFIPPAAPHFGGIWEAGVKAVKFHLNRVLGQTSLTFEELYTLLCQVEHCLNTRPLCSASDTTEIDVLTANHFLIGCAGGLLPSLDNSATKINLIRRWKYVQTLHCDLWNRWRDEYLRRLQQRTKWTNSTVNLEVGQIVLIRGENTPPAVWPLAKVIALHPASDGFIRVATLKTRDGFLKRPITKLVKLLAS